MSTDFPEPEALRPEDERRMDLALEEARRAWRISPPNPSVGAVIVKDGRVIGTGHTQRTGGPHAEVMALRDAARRGESVAGATVYVTLEPCSHWGRTPPCALALIEARVGRVVAATGDPNPKVHGRGLRMLSDAGIAVSLGVRDAEAREVNAGFLKRMTEGRPWVRVKTATTLDGRTALADGRSKWITGEAARADVQLWRARSGAVLTGVGTVLADDPQMNVRLEDQERQPLRVVVDARLETPPSARILHSPGGAVLFVAADGTPEVRQRLKVLESAGAEVIFLPEADNAGRVDLAALLRELGRREVNEVHVEAGARLTGAFLEAGLADEVLLYMAPCFFGEGLPAASVRPPENPAAAFRWKFHSITPVGGDIRILLRR